MKITRTMLVFFQLVVVLQSYSQEGNKSSSGDSWITYGVVGQEGVKQAGGNSISFDENGIPKGPWRNSSLGDKTMHMRLVQKDGDKTKWFIIGFKGAISGDSGKILSITGSIESLEDENGRIPIDGARLRDGTIIFTAKDGYKYIVYNLDSNGGMIKKIPNESAQANEEQDTVYRETDLPFEMKGVSTGKGGGIVSDGQGHIKVLGGGIRIDSLYLGKLDIPLASQTVTSDNMIVTKDYGKLQLKIAGLEKWVILVTRAQEESFKKLLGGNQQLTEPLRDPPAFDAAAKGDLQTLQCLTAADPNLFKSHRGDGASILHLAAGFGTSEIVVYLIEHGADVNATNKIGGTPLHWAASTGKDAAAEILLTHGANANARDLEGKRPLHQAASRGYLNICKLLVAAGAEIDASGAEATTPLGCASGNGETAVVGYLLSLGVNVNKANKYGASPLVCAAQGGYGEIVKLLVDHKAEINLANTSGVTALHMAVDSNHPDIVGYLLDNGADVNMTNKIGETPLHWATFAGNDKVVDILLNHGAKVNVPDIKGERPLHQAAASNHPDIVGYLLNHGADINAKDNANRTPLWWARQKGFAQIVQVLEKAGGKE